MAWDVLNRILEFARVRKLLNEDLLLGMKPFKDSGPAAELLKQRERVQLRSKFVFPNRSGGAPNVRWATDVVLRRILERAEVPHSQSGSVVTALRSWR